VNHFICHVYPRRQYGTWRRAVQHFKARWHLFDGVKAVAIAQDSTTDHADTVREAFGDATVRYAVFANNARLREVQSFSWQLEQVIREPGHTFACHCKGCTHPPESVCQWWCDVMSTVLLDYPGLVDIALAEYPIVGSLKRYEGLKVPWHYAGTYYWFDNAIAQTRPWQKVDKHGWGSESWPGRLFTRQESPCLFLDNCGNPYDEAYWKHALIPAFEYWRAAVHSPGWSPIESSKPHSLSPPETSFPPLSSTRRIGYDTILPASASGLRLPACLRPA
jgi:hypothetical protein